ncbi:GFA family protein [Agaribacterium haliotis]|uniref:GFA family protein n=1 Tax=Agaribacterium haliotis TaxID=2013869 RepID=UPI000BB563E6|nr:GFA family protein [Agaribacterium haliotis]
MKGSCLCGKVRFSLDQKAKLFQYCHCSRCQKITGSAFAANLYADPASFKWLEGEELVGRYEVPDAKYFATGFCKNCGSSLPWLAKGGRSVVIPAGSFDEDPGLRPKQNTFWADKACWYEEPASLPCYKALPERKS